MSCHTCVNVKNTDAVFRDFTLAVRDVGPARTGTDGPDAIMDVREALRQHLAPEQLRDREQYQCDFCGCKRDAERGVQLIGSYRRSSPCTSSVSSTT